MSDHLDTLLEFLRFPSVSTDSSHVQDVADCADWIDAKLTSLGLSSTIHQTAGHPIVVARNEHKDGRPTVLIYGHYDVQPADPLELWDTPPFEPVVRDGIIYARGATDNKGQMLAHILGVGEAMAADGDLPVNIILLFEGEEEIGSPNLEPFLREHREELACDIVAVSDTGMVAPGIPTFTYGLRGITCLELDVVGPSADLHSGCWGGSIANPASAIARLAASLHNPDGSVAIPGFYDQVTDLQDWERDAWEPLNNDQETLDLTGSPTLVGEPGFSDVERRWGRPTAEINGIGSGYQGEGSKTIIPSRAHLKISFRLVPNQDPDQILELAEAHLRAQPIEGCTLEITRGHSGSAYVMDPHSDFGKAAQAALVETFSNEVSLIREGGSIPIIQSFKDVLEADTLLLGLALPDAQIHSPNENFPVANFEAGIQLNQVLLRHLAGVGDA